MSPPRKPAHLIGTQVLVILWDHQMLKNFKHEIGLYLPQNNMHSPGAKLLLTMENVWFCVTVYSFPESIFISSHGLSPLMQYSENQLFVYGSWSIQIPLGDALSLCQPFILRLTSLKR